MHDEQRPEWQVRLAKLRAQSPASTAIILDELSGEALMTIVAIMKDHDDPKLQMAAAKMLLDKRAKITMPPPSVEPPMCADDIDAAVALAKKLLDEFAKRAAGELDRAGDMAVEGKG